MFFGVYENTADHQLPFKSPNIPEVAFIMNIYPESRDEMKLFPNIATSLKKLSAFGFEENLFTKLTPNPWQFLFRRFSMSEMDGLTLSFVEEFIKSTIEALYSEQTLFKFLLQSGADKESTVESV